MKTATKIRSLLLAVVLGLVLSATFAANAAGITDEEMAEENEYNRIVSIYCLVYETFSTNNPESVAEFRSRIGEIDIEVFYHMGFAEGLVAGLADSNALGGYEQAVFNAAQRLFKEAGCYSGEKS